MRAAYRTCGIGFRASDSYKKHTLQKNLPFNIAESLFMRHITCTLLTCTHEQCVRQWDCQLGNGAFVAPVFTKVAV
jgi:hypothetical protein